MCHSHYAIDFHSRVNFLVGSNGSGKSAILAALVLGLGGNARATNRSSSVKGFIKNGEATAKIEIVIANDGPQPYEPKTYGEKITIVRTISTSSGSYTIKSSNGLVVTKKIDDLHRILMYHNVQVDNPVFVLNQDSAREFLKELEPKKNYCLFLKATQIDIVTEKLNECLHLHRSHVHELSIYQTKLQKQRQDITEHEEKLEEFKSFEKLKDNLKSFEVEHAWLLVEQSEDALKPIDEKIEKYLEKEKELQQTIQNKDHLNLVLNQQIKKNSDIIATKKNDYQQENMKYRQIQIKVDEKFNLLTESKEAKESLKKKKSRLEKLIEEIKQHIEERSNCNQEDVDSMRVENEKKVVELRSQCTNHLAPMIENLKRDLKLLSDNKSQNEQIIAEIRRKQRECHEEIRARNIQIENVKASVKNQLLIYGEHMPALINEIKKANSQGKFSQLPRGPIGSYVEVPNRQYRDVVENVLSKSLLNAFIVNNTGDRQTLERMLSQYSNNRPNIITTTFRNQVHNVSAGRVHPPQGTRLLMDEIKCNDPVVMNCLIDRVQIETVLITDSKEVAEDLTSVLQNVPRNLNKIIVLREDNIGLEYHPSPRYRMYSSKIRQANFIQVNIDERIRNLENEKSNLEKKIKTFENDLNHVQKQLPQHMKNINDKRSMLQQHENKYSELEEKISELQNVEYADYSNEIEYLKKEVDEAEIGLEEVNKKLREKLIQYSDLEREKQELEDDTKIQKTTLEQIQNEIESYQTQADQLKIKLRSINDNESKNCDKLTELKSKLVSIQSQRENLLKNLSNAISVAEEKGQRIGTENTLEEIQDSIAKIKAKLKHGMPANLDPQAIQELIMIKQENFEASQGTYSNIKSSIDVLRKSLKFRFNFLKKLKEHMALMLQHAFRTILKLRDFEGNIDINHQDQTLKISVVPRDHNTNAVSNTKALSGGERSYSTVAFLISLWSCVDHPFYFLDEYDVFTDEVNREYMTRLLIDEGRRRPIRQYSFITPQDMSLVSENFIQIHNFRT